MGLNNLKTNSILDVPFSEYFGFTPDEVKELLQYLLLLSVRETAFLQADP